MMNCEICQSALPDLLLDPAAPSNAAARAHLDGCAECSAEFQELQGTFALLDEWEAPEISPWFDQKLAARLRQEQQAAPEGFLARLKDRLLFNTGRQFRPALVGSLALLLLAGGGAVGISTWSSHSERARASATVNDLQILDNNQQALQQEDQLLQDDASPDEVGPPS